MVQELDGHMQGPIMSLALDGHLLISKGEAIVGGNIVDDGPEALHGYVLGDVGLIQDLDLKCPMRLGVHDGVLLRCSITLNSLCWMIRRNSFASSADIFFLLKSSSPLANLAAEIASSRIGFALSLSSMPTFAFPFMSLDRTNGLGAAKIHPLRVILLVPEMLVTLAEDRLSPMDLSFLLSGF